MCSNSKQGYEGVLVMEAFSAAGLDCASWGASKLKIFRFSPGAAIYLLISREGFLKIKMFLQYSVFCTGLKGGREGNSEIQTTDSCKSCFSFTPCIEIGHLT